MADPQPETRGSDDAATWRTVSTILAVVAALAVGYAMVATRLSQPPAPAAPPPPAPAAARAAPPAPEAAPTADPAPAQRPVHTVPRDPEPVTPDAAAPATAASRVAAGECSGANDLFAWGCRAEVAGLTCARVARPAAGAEPEAANYLCAVPEANVRWLDARPAAGSECSQVMVPRARNAWSGAFLCVAAEGPLSLRASFARPIEGADCIEGWEPWTARRGTQNYLCWSARGRPARARDAGID